MRKKIIHKPVYIVFLLILLVSSIICITLRGDVDLPIYQLPLLCLLCFLLFLNIRKNLNSLVVLTISIVSVIRYGIYPITLCLESSVGSSYVLLTKNALNLMAYEMVVVMFILNIYVSRLNSVTVKSSNKIIDYKLSRLNKILLLMILPLVMVFPSLLNMFAFWGAEKVVPQVSGVISITFKMGLYIGYLLLLSKFSKNGRGTLWELIISLVIAVVYIFLIAVGESSVARWTFLWIGIPTLMILMDLFPRYKRIIISFSCIALPVGIIVGSFLKFTLTDFSLNSFFINFVTSNSLSEYFGGLSGLSYVLEHVAHDYRTGTMYSTLTDLFCSTPLLSAFFDFDNFSTQSIYLDYLNRTDLICPLLGQSYLHFGFLGAPIFSVLMIVLAIESERVAKKAGDVYLKYAALSLCLIFSLFMCLNTIIIFSNAWVLIIFLFVQLYNNNK